SGNNFWCDRNLRAWSFDGGRGLSVERTWAGGWRGEILQRGFSRQIGRRVLDGGQGKRLSFGGPLRGRGKGRIFRLQPAEQDAAFFGIGRDQADASRRRQKRDGRRINDLENVKAKGVKQERSEKKSCDGPLAAAGLVPGKDEARIVCGKQRSAHLA